MESGAYLVVGDAGLAPGGTAHGRQAVRGTCDAPARAPRVRAQRLDLQQNTPPAQKGGRGSGMVGDAGLAPGGTAHGRQAVRGTCDAPVRAPRVRAQRLDLQQNAPPAQKGGRGSGMVGDAGLEPATPCL